MGARPQGGEAYIKLTVHLRLLHHCGRCHLRVFPLRRISAVQTASLEALRWVGAYPLGNAQLRARRNLDLSTLAVAALRPAVPQPSAGSSASSPHPRREGPASAPTGGTPMKNVPMPIPGRRPPGP
jgi:hypothetical protein